MNDAGQGFETAMKLGLDAHAASDHAAALIHRFEAFSMRPPTPVDRGRAARDISASFDRMGDADPDNAIMADAYAEYAYREHRDMRDGNPEGAREFTVSAMYAAVRAARQGRGEDARRYIGEGWETSRALRVQYGGTPHQYDVNMAGRMAGIEAMFGGRPSSRGVRMLGREAISLAKISETPAVLGANRALSEEQVKRAQRNALIRGIAANTIIGLESLPTRKLTRRVSNLILQKAVL